MSRAQATAEQLSPTNSDLQQATIKALEPRFKEGDVRAFLDKLASSAAPALRATIEWNIAIWGKLVVLPDDQPWRYDVTVWGEPSSGSAVGFMYTAEGSLDKFFQDVTAFSLQPIGGVAGMLQINWFNSSNTPIGQCNAVAGGIGLVQATGGPGKWQHT